MASVDPVSVPAPAWSGLGIFKSRSKQQQALLSPGVVNFIAGWGAGIADVLTTQPLDTTKVRMQMAQKSATAGHFKPTFFRTFAKIAATEGPVGLYSGLSSVITFVGPKIALRFTAFEYLKKALAGPDGKLSSGAIAAAGLASGIVEAVVVVTPMEVIKIKLQSGERVGGVPRYTSVPQTITQIIRDSGVKGLYNGLAITAARQATNQATIFTTYAFLKGQLEARHGDSSIPGWQVTAIGLLAGLAVPVTNTPIDTIKTRLQKSTPISGQSELQRARIIVSEIVRNEGVRALYRGCVPRLLRCGPQQAVTFTAYEQIKSLLTRE